MKVVSYNLRFGGNKGSINPWESVIKEFTPDIVFAQESLDPREYFARDVLDQFREPVWSQVPKVKWGSAILSRTCRLEPRPVPGFEGWVVGALARDLIVGGVARDVLVYSIHAPSPGPYLPVVNRILGEIAKTCGNTPMIVAGDFNVTTASRHKGEELQNSAGEKRLLERLRREFRLFNAWQTLHPNEDLPQTLRWARDQLPHYHCDAVFVSDSHLSHLASATVESKGAWGEMSDHNPIVVTLN